MLLTVLPNVHSSIIQYASKLVSGEKLSKEKRQHQNAGMINTWQVEEV